jgi:hypothetical protein
MLIIPYVMPQKKKLLKALLTIRTVFGIIQVNQESSAMTEESTSAGTNRKGRAQTETPPGEGRSEVPSRAARVNAGVVRAGTSPLEEEPIAQAVGLQVGWEDSQPIRVVPRAISPVPGVGWDFCFIVISNTV